MRQQRVAPADQGGEEGGCEEAAACRQRKHEGTPLRRQRTACNAVQRPFVQLVSTAIGAKDGHRRVGRQQRCISHRRASSRFARRGHRCHGSRQPLHNLRVGKTSRVRRQRPLRQHAHRRQLRQHVLQCAQVCLPAHEACRQLTHVAAACRGVSGRHHVSMVARQRAVQCQRQLREALQRVADQQAATLVQ